MHGSHPRCIKPLCHPPPGCRKHIIRARKYRAFAAPSRASADIPHFSHKKGPEGPWLRIRSLAVIDWLSTNHFLDRHFTQDAAVLDGAADRTILDTRNTGQLIHFGLEHLTARNGVALILIDTLTIA